MALKIWPLRIFVCISFLLLSIAAAVDHHHHWPNTLDNRLPDVHFVGAGHNADNNDINQFVEVYPQQQTAREGGQVLFDCRPHNVRERVRIHWHRHGGVMPAKAIVQGSRLIIPDVKEEDAGAYICKISSLFTPKEAEGLLNVESIDNGGGVQEQRGPGRCLDGEATCQNGECVKREYVCDGQRDCRDGSDEFDCPAPQACEPNEFQCANRNCVQKMWLCDGDDDCGDGSDERNCGERRPGDACAPFEFQCKSQMQCIPSSFHCDGQNDCVDGSDEIGCAPPVCVQPPERSVNANCGQTVVISCRAVGVPTPYINWRLNWGPTCTPSRCVQASENGFGKLTIHNASDIDQGAYTCEAINSKGRILATPDAILTVQCRGPPTQPPSTCNSAGSVTAQPGYCKCKHFVTGVSCSQCVSDAYYLSPRNPNGCIQCFCSGVTKNCRSSTWHRTQARLTFSSDPQDVQLSDFSERVKQTSPRLNTNKYGFVTTEDRFPQIMYWSLPLQMRGNKITAYGGRLRFKLQFACRGRVIDQQPLVVLKGNEITLIARSRQQLHENRENEISIDMFETSFEREDGQPSTREHLLMTLSHLDSFMIRASHCENQTSSSLGDVSMDIAVDRDTQQEIAYEVEHCQCPPGYQGLSCEECAPGYQRSGGGLYLGLCERITTETPLPSVHCNADGALTAVPDYRLGRCQCKALTQGVACDQCKPGSFYLNQENPNGCINCFCFGVSNVCDSSELYRTQVSLLNSGHRNIGDDLVVGTSDVQQGFSLPYGFDSDRQGDGGATFRNFYGAPAGKALYAQLPRQYLGNKVTSYGGVLKISINYRGFGADNHEPLVILRGNDVTLTNEARSPIPPAGGDHVFNVHFYESHWRTQNSQIATREQLMLALADVSSLLVKLTFKERMESVTINDISMDYTSSHPVGVRAWAVEQCRCPPEYIGTSCEECAPGYTRRPGHPYLGTCERCRCHGHSDRCDPKTGICFDCLHNTEGDQCERCMPGFEGDARRGTPNDCFQRTTQAPCYCHNHSPRGCDSYGRCLRCEHNTEGNHCERCKAGYYGNATDGTPFDCRACPCPGARECFLDADGQVTCRGCPAGYTGRMCHECAPGYARHPSDRQRCKPIGAFRVTIQPPKMVQIEEGTTAVFRCNVAEGYEGDAYTITWSRLDGTRMPVNSIDRNGVLTLYSVTTVNSGTYRCTATTSSLEATDDAQLVVVPRRQMGQIPTVTVQPQHQSVQRGEAFQIRCSAEGSPKPTLHWEKDNDQMPADVEIFDGGILVIRQADTRHSGIYYCVARNPSGMERAPARIMVEEGGRPQVRIDPGDLRIKQDETAQFRCYAGESPDMSYEWTGPTGGPLRPGVEQNYGMLVIRRAVPSDSGIYTCTAKNRYGQDQGRARLTVEGSPSRIHPTATPSVQTVKLNEPAEFYCQSSGDPPPVITWGWSIPAGPLRPGIRQDEGRLFIPNARKSDEGSYYCTASNQYATESVPVTLYVEEAGRGPVVRIEPTNRWEGNAGEHFDFQCVATGTPTPRISWSRQDGTPLPNNVLELPGGVLRVSRLSQHIVGKYVCSASNAHGSSSSEATVSMSSLLNVKILPNVPELEIMEGQPLSLECLADGTPKPTIEWLLDMGPSRGDVPDGYKPAKIDGRFIRHDAVSPANEGVYKCRASNGVLSAEESIRVKVVSRLKRQVVILGGSERLVEPGDDVEMSCVLPNPTDKDMLWWTRVDGNLTERHEEFSVGVLRIVIFRPEDSGYYECQSYDVKTNQKVSSGRIMLIDASEGPSSNVLYVDGPEIRVLKTGETLQLDCTTMTDSLEPNSELRWFVMKADLKEMPTRGTTDDGILVIRNMTMNDSGAYKCVRFVDGVRAGGEFQNIVLVSNRDSEPVSVSARSGADLELHCPVYIVSGMSIVWSKKDDAIPEGAMAEADVLIIPDFQKHKAGTYLCEATVGDAVAIGAVRPIVAEADAVQLLIDVHPEHARIGEQVRFRCIVDGDADANVQWEKRGGQLPPSARINGNILTLSSVVNEDSGIYRCVASTRAGILTTDAVFHVGSKVLTSAHRRYFRAKFA